MIQLRIFVSSPGDVGREREIVQSVIARVEGRFGGRVRLEPYYWEHEPMRATRGDFQQQIPEPAEFDLFICILWSRLGSRLHPGRHARADGTPYASGTEYEFENAVRSFEKTSRPDLMVYRRKETPLFPPEPRAEMEERLRQWEGLKQFCQQWFLDGEGGTFRAAYNSYRNLAEFEERLETHLVRIVTERLGNDHAPVLASRVPPQWTAGSPYRGLQAFDFEHERVFFGRTQARDEVLGALRARAIEEQRPFVLIFGASGSGKSSLLRAGVMPWLVRPGLIEGVGLWRWAIFRPADGANSLLETCAAALMRPTALPELAADGTDAPTLARMLRDNPGGAALLLKEALSRAAREAQLRERWERQPVARLALGLDQLEEIFTITDRFGVEDRRKFFEVIDALVRSGFVWVVATLRSDYFRDCETVPELVRLKQGRGQYHLLAPTASELSQMIRLPAEAAGLAFEEVAAKGRLEDVIRDAALAEPGGLPLLEFALDELYRAAGSEGRLRFSDYERLGGVLGALRHRAEEAWAQLRPEQQQAFDRVFRALVRLGDSVGEGAVRRVADYAAFPDVDARGLVDGFVAARLLIADADAAGRRTVGLAHEALLRVWPRLTEWVEANRDFLRVRSRVGQSMVRWREAERHEDFLLTTARPLAEAVELVERHGDALDADEKDFIRASRASVERSARRRRRVALGAIAGLSALCLAAVWLWRESEQQRRAADMMREIADTRGRLAREQARHTAEVAARADYNLAMQERTKSLPRMLAHLARAVRTNPDFLPARDYLVATLARESWRFDPIRTFKHDRGVDAASYNPEGTLVLTRTQKAAQVWNVATGLPAGPAVRHELVAAALSPDGRLLAISGWDDGVFLYEVSSGKPVGKPFDLRGTTARRLDFSPDGERLVVATDRNYAELWNVKSGERIGPPMMHAEMMSNMGDLKVANRVVDARFSPNGKLILTADASEVTRLWDGATAEPAGRALPGLAYPEFGRDGAKLFGVSVLGSGDRVASFWDLATFQPVAPTVPNVNGYGGALSPDNETYASYKKTAIELIELRTGRLIGSLADGGKAHFSFDSRLVATASFDTMRVWDVATATLASAPVTYAGAVTSVQFSPKTLEVLSASADGTASIHDFSPPLPIGFGVVSAWAVSDDGQRALVPGQGRTVRILDLATGEFVGQPLEMPGEVTAVRFNPGGKRVATASRDGTVQVWEVATGKPAAAAIAAGEPIFILNFTTDGRTLHTVGADGRWRRWDAATAKSLGVAVSTSQKIPAVRMSPDGTHALVYRDEKIEVWDAISGKVLHSVSNGTSIPWRFSHDGTRFTGESGDRRFGIWETATGKVVTPPLDGVEETVDARFSPDDRQIATVASDGTVRVWDSSSGVPRSAPLRHAASPTDTGRVSNIAFSPDGRRLATMTSLGVVRCWDLATGAATPEMQDELLGPLDSSLNFSADGRTLILEDHDAKMIELWDVGFVPRSPAPSWLPELAEAIGTRRFDDDGELVAARRSLRDLRETLTATKGSDEWSALARWCFVPARNRTLSPRLATTVERRRQLEKEIQGIPESKSETSPELQRIAWALRLLRP